MKTHLVRWQEAYGKRGLVVVEVDNGMADTFEAVREDYQRKDLNFPVLWDRGGRTFQAYGLRAVPASYLIGADGKVVWQGVPVGKEQELEKAIAAEVAKVTP